MNKQEYLSFIKRVKIWLYMIQFSPILFFGGFATSFIGGEFSTPIVVTSVVASFVLLTCPYLLMFRKIKEATELKEKCLNTYMGDMTPYFDWHMTKEGNKLNGIPIISIFWEFKHRRELKASREVVRKAIEEYQE